MERAVFLFQDIIWVRDRIHLHNVSGIALSPEAILGLRVLQKSHKMFVFANHPDEAHEETVAEVERLQEQLPNLLARYGVCVQRLPHPATENGLCLESPLSLLSKIAEEHRIDLSNSLVISNRLSDVECAAEVGVPGIYIVGEREPQPQLVQLPNCLIATDILDAALLAMERHLSRYGEQILVDVERAAMILKDGGVVAFPTETVYGLGANALDPIAVARIFEIKGRPRFDPLIVHVAALHQVQNLVTELPEPAQALMGSFWPGPLTLVLPKSDRVPEIVTAGLPTVAVRMPDHPVALTLIRRAGVPIAAPSANRFGRVSPTTAEHVHQQLGSAVDLILDGGRCPIGVESTIISVLEDTVTLLRPGGTPLEEVERLVGPVQRRTQASAAPLAPGQLAHHYAPQTPLVLKGQELPERALRRGLLSFTVPASAEDFVAVEVLSKTGDLREAAANLFAALHRLDAMHLDVIVAELVPEVDLGLAINDRLRRAARK
jgi:L-threonylcarbamoyladenylate synthase